jgi:beta-glucosidase
MTSRPESRVAAGTLALGVALAASGAVRAQAPAYRDPGRSVEERVQDLLARMTLEEKVAQLQGTWQGRASFQDPEGIFVADKAKPALGLGLGQVSRPSEIGNTASGPRVRSPREHAEFVNAIQKWVAENTRLGIPVMFHEEALHGFVAPGATHFPVPLALGSTWDPALVERVMSVAAREARARGCQQVLSPVVDLARDPRWGRIEETYGEDPYLVSRMGVAAVRGYQGTAMPLARDKVLATLKHFLGHGSHEGGINTAPSLVPERLLRSELLVPFETAVKEAGAYCVMPSYNEVDGVPSHKNRRMIQDVLRGEWGFQGLVTSDYFAVQQLLDRHHVAKDKADAARQAIESGVDVELPDADTYGELVGLARAGHVSQKAIDAATARVLRAKFLSGLFEQPMVDPAEAERVTNTPEHRAVALEAAREAIVLLKNDGGLLPLDRRRVKTLAVIGPNARGLHLGGYSTPKPGHGVDLLDGIKEKAGPGVEVVYAEGVRITEAGANWWMDKVTMADPAANRTRIREAVTVAAKADAVVVAIGTNEATSREAWADDHLGDAADLSLTNQQDELVEAMLKTGKPLVVVLVNGRPLAIPRVAAAVPAILEGFYLGQEGGTAVGEALFGDLNPGGKLPVSFPRHVGQLPVYYNRRPTSFRSYLDLTREPLWPFGFGLSYTTFKVDAVTVSPARIPSSGKATVSARVTNTGGRAGDEVVQLYVHDQVSSVTRPVQELCGFRRVSLLPGASQTVTFTVGPEALSLVDESLKRVVEPGLFDVMVGTSSTSVAKVVLEVQDQP